MFLVFSLVFAATSAWGATCSVASSGINFGNYDVFVPTPTASTGTIDIVCDQTQPDIVIFLGPSSNSGVFIPRQMRHASKPDLLNYNIYTTSSMSTVWGNGTQGTSTVNALVRKKDQPATVTFFGRITSGQDISAGFYSDVLTVTINW
jgi:spore coat protein U-like protein